MAEAYFYVHSSPPQPRPTSFRWCARELKALNIVITFPSVSESLLDASLSVPLSPDRLNFILHPLV